MGKGNTESMPPAGPHNLEDRVGSGEPRPREGAMQREVQIAVIGKRQGEAGSAALTLPLERKPQSTCREGARHGQANGPARDGDHRTTILPTRQLGPPAPVEDTKTPTSGQGLVHGKRASAGSRFRLAPTAVVSDVEQRSDATGETPPGSRRKVPAGPGPERQPHDASGPLRSITCKRTRDPPAEDEPKGLIFGNRLLTGVNRPGFPGDSTR